ncbi:flagellar biosynthesis protein FlgL [Pseudotabrizicola algicola]|uniref:Flagellar biosynthesis protein FlgL n=1 Tax=Pseudotabrizicola algicola TaxID=2709381 RepID=A0A6B3RM33_9RHOB|nr:flagellar biosynthesis protein FlgL [Pseudotabrizicola algicola]NEX46266.1 flagellar biosynthesis protein FlgL [Pseudotabrizicola algicola]
MALISLGDLAQSFLLKSQTGRLKGEAGRITRELASGQVADVGATLSGDMARLMSESRARVVTAGYQSAAREAAAQAGATQAALELISGTAQAMVSPLLGASQLNLLDQIGLATENARGRLETVLATLNTSVGGRSLFAGQAVDRPAVAGAETILTALRGNLAGANTAGEAMARIEAWFDAPGGYAATTYQGGAALGDVAISAKDRVWLGVTAEDPALRHVLGGLAAAALITDSALGLPLQEAKALARLSAERLLGGQEKVTTLAARVGISEGRIEAAQSRNAADLLMHEMAQADLIRSDPERLAMELEAVQTNLETMFAITARLSRLSLTDFLR